MRIAMHFAVVGALWSAMALSAAAADKTLDCRQETCSFNESINAAETDIFTAQCFQGGRGAAAKLSCSSTNEVSCTAENNDYQCECKNNSSAPATIPITIDCS